MHDALFETTQRNTDGGDSLPRFRQSGGKAQGGEIFCTRLLAPALQRQGVRQIVARLRQRRIDFDRAPQVCDGFIQALLLLCDDAEVDEGIDTLGRVGENAFEP